MEQQLDKFDGQFDRLKGHFNDLNSRFDVFGLATIREWDDNGRCARDEAACRWPIDRPSIPYRHKCDAFLDELEEDKEHEEELFGLTRHDCDGR